MFTFEIKYKAFEKTFLLRTLSEDRLKTYTEDEEVEWIKDCKGDFIFREGKICKEQKVKRENTMK